MTKSKEKNFLHKIIKSSEKSKYLKNNNKIAQNIINKSKFHTIDTNNIYNNVNYNNIIMNNSKISNIDLINTVL